jgi:cytochrome c-type biogenesis protein CcmH/NrfG
VHYVTSLEEVAWGIALVAITMAIHGCGMLATLFAWTSTRPLVERALGGATLYALALGCKESLVVLPPLVAVAQAYVEHGPWRARVRAAALQLGVALVVSALFFAWRAHLHILSGSSVLDDGPRALALALATVIAHYAGLALRFQQAATALSWRPLSGLAASVVGLALALVALALWQWSRRDKVNAARVAFGTAWFLAFTLPNALVIPVTGQFSNRYLYIPLVGFVFVAASIAHALLQNRAQAVQRACALGGALLVLVGALVNADQASRWRTGLALFGADVFDHPDDARVIYHYAVSVVRTRGCPAALPLFLRATELEPGYARPWHNVAGCLLNLGRYRDAVLPAERAWRLEPGDPSKLLNLGVALVASGDNSRGRPLLTHACQALPREPGCALLR